MSTQAVLVVGWLLAGLQTTGTVNLIDEVELRVDERPGHFRTVIEIPAFTRAKWQVETEAGQLEWEVEAGRRRVIESAFPYLANYGMLPQTVEARDTGGDGNPLDVIVLGEPLQRGQRVIVRVIALMKMVDRGERDHKVIAVSASEGRFAAVDSLADLRHLFPGTEEILATWFAHYKGASVVSVQGFAERDAALEMIERAHEDWLRLRP